MTTEEREFDFALILSGIAYAESGQADPIESAANALYEAGCDDATLSLHRGAYILDFARRAGSLRQAIIGAIQDVLKNTAGIDVARVDSCHLVTQAEIAEKANVTRQAVNQYISGKRGPGGFPAPDCHVFDKHPLWSWCEVAYWLKSNELISQEKLDEARDVEFVNSILRWRNRSPADREMIGLILESLFHVDLAEFAVSSRRREPAAS